MPVFSTVAVEVGFWKVVVRRTLNVVASSLLRPEKTSFERKAERSDPLTVTVPVRLDPSRRFTSIATVKLWMTVSAG